MLPDGQSVHCCHSHVTRDGIWHADKRRPTAVGSLEVEEGNDISSACSTLQQSGSSLRVGAPCFQSLKKAVSVDRGCHGISNSRSSVAKVGSAKHMARCVLFRPPLWKALADCTYALGLPSSPLNRSEVAVGHMVAHRSLIDHRLN